jgi:rSAM/selenodomain-associated transferase 2
MRLSVIIPTLNEEESLPRALASVPAGSEVIVSDGQSTDRTSEIAADSRARVVTGPAGRATQMNLGARVAAGDVLLFLHADCALGAGAQEAIRRAFHDPRVVGGSFRLAIMPTRWSLRLVAFGSNLRARHFHLPYGDQAVFVRRADFDAVGGYAEIPIMEDVELVRKLRRRGSLVCLRETVTTEARHWDALGPFATTLVNWAAISLYFLGVSPTRLALFYRRWRKAKRPG